MVSNVYHRGGGYKNKQDAIDKESKAKRYYKIRLDKRREQWREHYLKYPDQHRERKLRSHYSISSKEYNLLLNKQNGVCAICGNPPMEGRALGVDHDHTTGKIRGLLCHKCNTGIGYLGDVTQSVQHAANYLQDFSQ